MNYYCTLFDSFYLSKGLAMCESLKVNAGGYHLFIYAFDDLSCEILKLMNLTSVTVVPLRDFESPELLAIKGARTKAEYCWTCTPAVISYSIKKFNLPECTYIDADLFFYSDPAVLLEEMRVNNKSVLITEHRFSLLAGWYELKRAGRFCVQFLTVKNEPESLMVLDQWEKQCINWCYARYENGKFGDQKYLEAWPSRYNNIHILQNDGGGLAPWNIQQYRFNLQGDKIKGIKKADNKEFDPVFYHFQYVRMISHGIFDIGWHLIPGEIKELFYMPYLKRLELIEYNLGNAVNDYKTIFAVIKSDTLKNRIKSAFKKTTGYNIITIN